MLCAISYLKAEHFSRYNNGFPISADKGRIVSVRVYVTSRFMRDKVFFPTIQQSIQITVLLLDLDR